MIELDNKGNLVCQPIKDLEGVINWTAFDLFSLERAADLKDKGEQCDSSCNQDERRRQVILVHDMMGGYIDDRFVLGCDNPHAYRFYHWHHIDLFVYFSHNFITIPPFGWISAAHKHGVQILGTLILNGNKDTEDLLTSRTTIDLVVTRLVQIADMLGFDGWFLDIQTEVKQSQVKDVLYFIERITHECHSQLKHGKCVWLNTMKNTGRLHWNNELTDQNELFFNACDGILLNNQFTSKSLQTSKEIASASNRCVDVYVQVDVFGRGTPGGGGFNSKEGLKMISSFGLSCALFAPGWVYEKHGAESFHSNENKFWKLMKDYLPWKPTEVPFATSFCQGHGQKQCLHGKVVGYAAWHNLSLQQIQPCYDEGISYTTHEAYNGGGCLQLNVTPCEEKTTLLRLCKIAIRKNKPLKLSVVWKNVDKEDFSSGLAFALLPTVETENLSHRGIVLRHNDDLLSYEYWMNSLTDEEAPDQSDRQISQIQFVNGVTSEDENNSGWKRSHWEFDTSLHFKHKFGHQMTLYAMLIPSKNMSIGTKENKQLSYLLGNLQVEWNSLSDRHQKEPVISDIICLQVNCENMAIEESKHLILIELDSLRNASTSNTDQISPQQSSQFAEAAFQQDHERIERDCHVRCRYKSCQLHPISDTISSVSLHFLNWKLNEVPVDYYLVFAVYDNDDEVYIGSTGTTSFVNRKVKKSNNLVGYSIQPIVLNSSKSYRKFKFSVP